MIRKIQMKKLLLRLSFPDAMIIKYQQTFNVYLYVGMASLTQNMNNVMKVINLEEMDVHLFVMKKISISVKIMKMHQAFSLQQTNQTQLIQLSFTQNVKLLSDLKFEEIAVISIIPQTHAPINVKPILNLSTTYSNPLYQITVDFIEPVQNSVLQIEFVQSIIRNQFDLDLIRNQIQISLGTPFVLSETSKQKVTQIMLLNDIMIYSMIAISGLEVYHFKVPTNQPKLNKLIKLVLFIEYLRMLLLYFMFITNIFYFHFIFRIILLKIFHFKIFYYMPSVVQQVNDIEVLIKLSIEYFFLIRILILLQFNLLIFSKLLKVQIKQFEFYTYYNVLS
ncbi:unnamed protein product [Paramecium sonneborni]|uniref:Transmembrane protein n=1 Tax=Paramecium sonneborni TaxID=65129 RepID=A0A8S1RNL8_9CILI|nr:unnamed protein product [Paramecium sonneborni]